MENITDLSSDSWSNDLEQPFDCNEVTNNGLYVLFVGYLLPLLSPKVREYGKEVLSMFRSAGKVASNVVSLTEFGFEKIQNLSNNGEMSEFIQRVCEKRNITALPEQIKDLAWSFSGDTAHGKKESRQETWKKLLNDLDRLNVQNTIIKNKP